MWVRQHGRRRWSRCWCCGRRELWEMETVTWLWHLLPESGRTNGGQSHRAPVLGVVQRTSGASWATSQRNYLSFQQRRRIKNKENIENREETNKASVWKDCFSKNTHKPWRDLSGWGQQAGLVQNRVRAGRTSVTRQRFDLTDRNQLIGRFIANQYDISCQP